jgi:hypothetical protein
MIEDQVKKFTVEENGKKVDVVIGMTEEESKDKSYVDYLTEGYTEKTKEQLRKQPPRPESKVIDSDRRGAIKEAIEYRKRVQSGGGKKYF